MADENTIAKAPAEETNSTEYTRCGYCFRPNVDIIERADELVVVADVPGAAGDDIAVDFEDGTLSIHAKAKPRQDSDVEYRLHEYSVGDYYRTFRVSEAVDAAAITAECADGVLTLRLPKAEAAKPRKINVKSQ